MGGRGEGGEHTTEAAQGCLRMLRKTGLKEEMARMRCMDHDEAGSVMMGTRMC